MQLFSPALTIRKPCRESGTPSCCIESPALGLATEEANPGDHRSEGRSLHAVWRHNFRNRISGGLKKRTMTSGGIILSGRGFGFGG